MSLRHVSSSASDELLRGAPSDCDLGAVEKSFGVVGCRAEGALLRSVMRTGPWMSNSSGQQAGALGVLLDHALAERLYAERGVGQRLLTTELAFDILAPPPWSTRAFHVTSWVPRREPEGGFAQCEMVDDHGTLVATGSTWTQYVRADDIGSLPGPFGVSDDCHTTSAVGFRAHLGARIVTEGEDVRIEVAEARRWDNPYGMLHGGIWASLTEMAAAEAFARRGCLKTAHVHVSYLRSPTAGASVSVVARPVHIGRSFGVVEIAGSDGSGRLCVAATVTGRRRADDPEDNGAQDGH